MIVEIAIDIPAPLIEYYIIQIGATLDVMQLPYYIEPPSKYYSLEELEADCEGK